MSDPHTGTHSILFPHSDAFNLNCLHCVRAVSETKPAPSSSNSHSAETRKEKWKTFKNNYIKPKQPVRFIDYTEY